MAQSVKPPLAGVRILDLSQVAAGPYGTSLLGDFGADIIKIEPLEGEQFRGIDNIFGQGESAYFYGLNRNKRCMALNLAQKSGRRVLDRMVATADVFIVAFRPSATRKLDLGYERLSKLNPRLVYCTITAFGETGPRAEEPGMDILAQALSGVMALTGEPARMPVKVGPPMADFVVSYLLSFAVCAALRVRDRDGVGQKIELNLLDGMVASVANYATPYMATRKPIRRVGAAHPQLVPYQVFEVSDGYIVVACLGDRFWPLLCSALGDEKLAADPRYMTNTDRVRNRDELVGKIQAILSTRTRAYWLDHLKKAGVPCSVVNELEDALQDPQVLHNDMLVELMHPKFGKYTVVNNPIKMSLTPAKISRPVAALGEHTEELMQELGYSHQDIAAMKASGTIGLASGN